MKEELYLYDNSFTGWNSRMLTIYKASAGAGKTHKLTGEYLLLLFSAPNAYKRILAVTFTNKATDEMKRRIIEELFKLASGESSDYMGLLAGRYRKSELQIRDFARNILITILHDYSAFNISTIDRFFQQTVRAFTREIGLQGGYGIEMDRDVVLNESIDNLLLSLDRPENKELLNWMLRFAEDKVESGSEWVLQKDIKKLSEELFKESYKNEENEVRADIADKGELEKYKETLFGIIRSTEKNVQMLGEKALRIMKESGLQVEDLKNGSRSPLMQFNRWANGEFNAPSATFLLLKDNPDACYKKTTPEDVQQRICRMFNNGLNDCICEIIHQFEDMSDYYTAKEIVRYYYTLGILSDISRYVADYRTEKNVMLIADTTELLHKVIGDSSTPFIYEKTGTRIDHYMIDEFQDTSRMQWENFRPLIEESLAASFDNLIVGDVKQSIYRFRNSDWELLDHLLDKEFLPDELKNETLKDNWRSCREIVRFNNSFFTISPSLLQQLYNETVGSSALSDEKKKEYALRIEQAYDESCQRVPAAFQEKEGHVRIEFIEDSVLQGWKELSLERLPGIIMQLQDNGYQAKDIAILTRTNIEGADVVESLLTYQGKHPDSGYNFEIISDDALYLGSSRTVQFFIALFRFLHHPEDQTRERIALLNYFVLKGTEKQECFSLKFFPEPLRSRLLSEISRKPIYELVESLLLLFSDEIPKTEQIFMLALLDSISEFSRKENPDLGRFLEWWDEKGYRTAINTPDGQDAIRVLTIHKSKGLGFKAVILPFGNWEIDHKPGKQPILWCRPQKKPFDRLHLVPVRYGQALANTIFAEPYFDEKLYAFIDNLNTLYVAFTRAKEELIVLAPCPKKREGDNGTVARIGSIADLLWNTCSSAIEKKTDDFSLLPLNDFFDKDSLLFECGRWWTPASKEGESFHIGESEMNRIFSVSPDERLHLRMYGKNYFIGDMHRKYGNLMHDLLSEIRTVADIRLAVEHYFLKGIIAKQEMDPLICRLEELLSKPEVQEWYDGSSIVYNEIDILAPDAGMKRPDRVLLKDGKVTVIDYKFGEQTSKRYHRQMENYIKLIKAMGYVDVKAYLWYVELDKIEEVRA